MEHIPLHPRKKSKLNCCTDEENDGLRVIVFCFGVLCICVTIALVISIYFGEPELAASAAVATDSQQCSNAGVQILLKGGNAVDAAISSVLCMSVVNPHKTSIGGGGVMIVFNRRTSKKPVVINFQDTAPSKINISLVSDNRGPLSVGIPGLLSGLWESHKMFGKLKWADLLEPAIRLCNNGIAVSAQLASAVHNIPDESPLRHQSHSLFFPDDIPLAEGQTLKQPSLGNTLDMIAKNGVEEFYKGKLASNLIQFMKNQGVEWTSDVINNYQAKVEEALAGVYKKSTIYTSGAPTSGPQLISLLNILEGFNLTSVKQLDFSYVHQLIESTRLTQTQVSNLGDPMFNEQIKETVNNMIDQTLADEVRNQIRPDSLLPVDTLVPSVPQSTASVTTVMDNNELQVSVVSGLNSVFGSHLVSPDGYLLNNAMANFYTNSSLPNSNAKAGQKPLQFMLPLIAVETNRRCGPRFVTGSSDATLLGQVVMNLLQFNLTVPESVRSPRIQTTAQSHALGLENDNSQEKLPKKLVERLVSMGHTITIQQSPIPSINVVMKTGDFLASQSDSRGGGYAVKYDE